MAMQSEGGSADSQDIPPEVQRALKPRRTVLKVLGAIVLALLVLWVVVRLVLLSNLRAEQRKIRARGEPVTLQELEAWYPMPGPGEANAADLYGQAFDLLQQADDKYGALEDSLPVVRGGTLPPRGEAMPEEMRKGMEEYLARRKRAMELLHQAATVKKCRYVANIAQEYIKIVHQFCQPHIHHVGDKSVGVLAAARDLNLEALDHAEAGRRDEAVQSLGAGFDLADSLAQEPMVNSLVVRSFVLSMVLDATERVLSRGPIADGQAQRLAERIKAADTSEPICRSLAGERCLGAAVFTMGGREIERLFGAQTMEDEPLGLALWKASGLRDAEHRRYLQLLTQLIEGYKHSPRAALKARRDMETSVAALPKAYVLTRVIARLQLVQLDFLGEMVYVAAAESRAAVTALAVERYRLAKGRLPERLEDLVPEFLEAVPGDPFDPSGGTLRYRRLYTGYVVYSVGVDGADDGGAKKGPDATFTVAR